MQGGGAKPLHSRTPVPGPCNTRAWARAWAWAVPGPCLGPCLGRAAGRERSRRRPRLRRTALPVGPIIKMFFGEICGKWARARAVGCAHACMAGRRRAGAIRRAVRAAWSTATHLLFQRRRHTLPPPAVAHRDRDGTLGFRLPDDVPIQLLDDLLRPQRLLQCHLRRLVIRSCCCRPLDGDLHFRLRRRALAHAHAVEGEGRGPKAPRH
jgi:hypothetical protein